MKKHWFAANLILLGLNAIGVGIALNACCSNPPAASCPPQPCQSVPTVEHFGDVGPALEHFSPDSISGVVSEGCPLRVKE